MSQHTLCRIQGVQVYHENSADSLFSLFGVLGAGCSRYGQHNPMEDSPHYLNSYNKLLIPLLTIVGTIVGRVWYGPFCNLQSRLKWTQVVCADWSHFIRYLDAGLNTQVQFDIESLQKAINRQLSSTERLVIQQIQTASYRQTFLVAGMTHPNFIKSVQAISLGGYDRIVELTQSFS